MKKILAAVGILALTVSMGLSGCSSQAAEGETVAVQSVSMLAGLGSLGAQNRFSGVVVAQATYDIKKDSERTVKKLKVAAGDEVKKGQILFTYDVEEIQMSIDMAKLELEKIENTITSTKSEIEKLEKEKAKAKSSEQLSYSIQIQTLQADVKESEYTLSTKKVELERLEKSAKNAKVRSEVAGIVQAVNDKNDAQYDDYGNELPYITIVETGSYRVKGVVNETNVSDIGMKEGSQVLIRSRVDAEQTWDGTLGGVDFENPEKNNNMYYYDEGDDSNSSSKYPFYVTLDNSEGLMMGQHVYIELNEGQDDEQPGIWIASYFLSDITEGKAVVWAATDKDKLEKRNIQLGEYNEEMDTYEIVGGLSAEDYIAIPEEGLKNGLPVARYDEAYFEDDFSDDMMYEGDFEGGEWEEGEFPEGAFEEGEFAEGEFGEGEFAEGEFPEGEMGDMEAIDGMMDEGAQEATEE